MKLIWLFVFVGGIVGGYLPELFHQGPFSLWGIIGGAVGSLVGIWLYVKMGLIDSQ